MTMTLRLDDDEDAQLSSLATALGISKSDAARRAISESALRYNRDAEVRRIAEDIVVRYKPLLDRLAE